ncbi:hypothetical protein M409DRAFT_50915 [Zasmidium cellare ATCC 36951]|uniref:Beta-lactamase-related domain-containing protein n=1 Tax=Zasmidium cellare ATCC 36951 TaxID=1080233 RepID=A0A6A6CZ54_ZASCE|nr:uncharacterized protein M409DRAFT_50915 [Zasmidium cellare ATCC 36951]KAF2171480.1 hypothetical protein M409DRAFT_50915 [Zasmidium cellare ATCC 36951]
MEQPHRLDHIKSILRDNIIAGGFSAAIASNNSTPIQIHSGHANIAQNEPLTSTHLFGIGSITKVFIAVVIFQLVEENRLSLTDTVSEYLSDKFLHDIDNAASATIAQLLSHEAGVDSWEDDPKWIVDGRGANINVKRLWGKSDTLEYVRRPRRTAPEQGNWYYSNKNYTLLGLIIEKITNNTAEGEMVAGRNHYATKQFHERAGVSPEFPFVLPDIFDATGSNLSVSWTAGGMMSSTSDFCKFALALRDGRLLEPRSWKIMRGWRTTTIEGHEMGHGIFRMTLPGKGSWLGHSGGVLGFSTGLWWKEDEDCVVCVMGNCGTVHAGKVDRDVNETTMSSSTLSRTISTPRLTIRLTDPDNEEDCKVILTFYDPVTRPDMQTPSDIPKKSEANMIKPDLCTLAVPPKGVFHLIFVNDSPDTSPIGFIGFSCRPNWPCSDLGYKLLPACRGKGYASEAGKAVLSFWRDEVGVKEICAPIGVANVASQRVAENIGFVRDREFHGNGEGWKKAGGDEGEVAYVLPGMEGRIDWDSMELE